MISNLNCTKWVHEKTPLLHEATHASDAKTAKKSRYMDILIC